MNRQLVDRRDVAPAAVLTLGLLGMAAAAYLAFHVAIAFGREDTENLEMTRVLATARQLEAGFPGLYGPFGGSNPWVLIQAPLYYRLTALCAMPLVGMAEWSPTLANMATGRAISFASLLGVLVVVWRLAGRDGGTARAGVIATLLVLGSPIVASFPVTLRPDMLGVALQLLGLSQVIDVLRAPGRRDGFRLSGAFVAFALAVMTKQHLVAGPVCALVGLGFGWRRGDVTARSIGAGLAAGAVVGLGYAGFEQWLTSGGFWRACFALPARLREVTSGDWTTLQIVFATTLRRSAGLLVLGMAAAVVSIGRRRQAAGPRTLEAVLGLHIGLELLLMVKLCLDSSGAWFNYAMPATISACVLMGRGLDRILSAEPSRVRAAAVVVGAVAILLVDVRLVQEGCRLLRDSRVAWTELEADPAMARHEAHSRYFSGMIQHYNEKAGRPDLAHDGWLYHAFEAIGAAESRTVWLERPLVDGSIDLVIVPARAGEAVTSMIPGLDHNLPELGYELASRTERFGLWERRTSTPSQVVQGAGPGFGVE